MSKVLELALSLFHQNNVRVSAVNKSNPTHFQIFYSKGSAQRVMLLPKNTSDLNKVQEEVLILVARNKDEQQKIGYLDSTPA